jgi:hypothetical protein
VNKSAETSLEKLATALEPFKDHSVEDLGTMLNNVHHYRQTGELPEALFTTKPKRASTRKPANPKPPKMTFQEAIDKLRQLQENAEALDPSQIESQIESLNVLTTKELDSVQKEFLGATAGKTKPQKLEALKKALVTFGRDQQRVSGILTS